MEGLEGEEEMTGNPHGTNEEYRRSRGTHKPFKEDLAAWTRICQERGEPQKVAKKRAQEKWNSGPVLRSNDWRWD